MRHLRNRRAALNGESGESAYKDRSFRVFGYDRDHDTKPRMQNYRFELDGSERIAGTGR